MTTPRTTKHPKSDSPVCEKCSKNSSLCLCNELKAYDNKLHVLIFQHPQEPDHLIGTARLAHLQLKNSNLRVGLSVPNLTKALETLSISDNGEKVKTSAFKDEIKNNEWGVLYLGSGIKGPVPQSSKSEIYAIKKDGSLLPDEEQKTIKSSLKGIILLDGTWSQAKALWWRNAWLLKCRRLVLVPNTTSLYGNLRKEPRKECLSTVETIAETLLALGDSAEQSLALKNSFKTLLSKYKLSKHKK